MTATADQDVTTSVDGHETGGGTRRVVRPHPGGWAVLAPGSHRAAWVGPDRGDAVARAQQIVRKAGGGTVEVLDGVGNCIETRQAPRVRAGARDLRVRH